MVNRLRTVAHPQPVSSDYTFRALIEQSSDGIIIIDDKGSVTEWNKRTAEITGISTEEAIGEKIWSLQYRMIPSYQKSEYPLKRIKAGFLYYKKTLTNQTFINERERNIQRKNGDIRVVRTVLFPIHTPAEHMFGTIIHDITEEKQASNRYKTIWETSLVGFIILDSKGNIIDTNTAYCQMIGYYRNELLQMNLKRIDMFQTDQDIAERINAVLQTGHAQFETKHTRKDGSVIDVSLSVYLFHEITDYVFVLVKDISQEKKQSEIIQQLPQRILEAHEEEKRLLSHHLHDQVGMSLALLKLQIQQFLDTNTNALNRTDLKSSPPISKKQILVSIDRAIDELRTVSQKLRPEALDHFGLSTAVSMLSKDMASIYGIPIRLDLNRAEQCISRKHAIEVYRIIQEALLNACKHSQAKNIHIRSKVCKAYLYIDIMDNGVGIGKNKHTNVLTTSGLNLQWGRKIMSERAALVGGTVQILPHHPHGTTVRVILPAC